MRAHFPLAGGEDEGRPAADLELAAVGHAFVEAVRGTTGEHRGRVLALVERSRDRRFVQPLFSLVQSLEEPAEAAEEPHRHDARRAAGRRRS